MEFSSEDIDARLARFEEESFEDDQNYSEYQNSVSRDYKNTENFHLIYNHNKYGEKKQNKGFINNAFQDSSDTLRDHLQLAASYVLESEPKGIRDRYNLTSDIFPVNSYKQKSNFRKQDKHEYYLSDHANPTKSSQFVEYNTQRFHPKIDNFGKEVEIEDTNFTESYRQMHESHYNAYSSDALSHPKNLKLDTSHEHEIYKRPSSEYESFAKIGYKADFSNDKNYKNPKEFKEIHGQGRYLLHYSRYDDFKKSEDISINSIESQKVPNEEKHRRIMKMGNSAVNNVKLKDGHCVKRKNLEEIHPTEKLSHLPNSFHVSKIHNHYGIAADVQSNDMFHHIQPVEKLRTRNPSIFIDDSEINQIHCEDDVSDIHVIYKPGIRTLNGMETLMSTSQYSGSSENSNIGQHKCKMYDNEGGMHYKSKNVHVAMRKRKSKCSADTLTMHDAHKIAPLVLNSITDDYSIENRTEISISSHEKCISRIKRKCWAKECWSTSKHSHGINISKNLEDFSRNAIVNSLKSPQYSAESKKKSCADCWSSFLKISSSRLQLWNSTLKKIEGQFGTGVVSYFVFLRWLILLNFLIFILYIILIIAPYSAFAVLPHRNVKAPNTTLFTEEYLEQFPKYQNIPYSNKRISLGNISIDLDEDLLSNVGVLFDNYLPDEIIDIGRYDRRNYTAKERTINSQLCKERYEKEMANHTKGTFSFLQDFLQGTGWLQSTILFLGFYPNRDVSYFGLSYNLPIAFLAVLIASFFLSLGLMLQYSSHGIEENVLTQKSNYLTFSNILFCSWDYCIEDKKTADIRHKSITCEIKSNLAEEYRKNEVSHWSSEKRMKVYILRAVINMFVIAALFGCFYLIYTVVNIQLEKQRQNALKDAGVYTLYIQFLPPLVITALNIIMPIIFSALVKLEMYSSRTQVNIALFRIVFLRLASVFVLVSTLYQQITCEPKDNCRAGMTEFCRAPICWETYVGQQLYKLVITDFLVYLCMFLAYDLPRDFIVQRCKCKVTEVVGRQVFDIPSQVLSLVYSQTLCWLGLFYSPILPGISVLKFFIIFYLKKLVVLKHCAPSPVLYKASRSNSIFMTILMLSLFVVTTIHGYCLTSIAPSPGCSPFREYDVMMQAISDAIDDWSPYFGSFMKYLFSAFFFIPAFLLLILIIYYYWTIVVAHRKMTKVLKAQIAVEGRDKQFLLNRLAEAARQITTN